MRPSSSRERTPPYLSYTPDGVVLRVHVQPRASRTEIAGIHGTSLKIRIQAPPVDGAANKACRAFLAKILSIPRSRVILKAGGNSREKTFLLEGLDPDAVRDILHGRPA